MDGNVDAGSLGTLAYQESYIIAHMKRNRVLIFTEWFAPGFKAGGPITSVVNFVCQLKDNLDIFIFTTDTDLGDQIPYVGVRSDQWTKADGFSVYYSSRSSLNRQKIQAMIREVNPDVVFLNSMYSLYFTIIPLLARQEGGRSYRIILSPRGMLRSSALSIKPMKKRIFLTLCRIAGIAKKVEFLATDDQEVSDIRKVFGVNTSVEKIGNLPGPQPPFVVPPAKEKGLLRLIFVGRIHPIKNLLFLLEALRSCKTSVDLSIAGPMEDPQYWAQCQQLIAAMSGRVRTKYYDSVDQKRVLSLLQDHHAFVLPTTGENFGHAIFEALSAGRPVLISDQTPWRKLEEHSAGWDLSIKQVEPYAHAIDGLGEMDHAELNHWCLGAWKYCEQYMKTDDVQNRYLRFFNPA